MLLNGIDKAYFNNSEVDTIYLGDTLIFPSTPPTPPPHDYSQDYLTFETSGADMIKITISGDTLPQDWQGFDLDWGEGWRHYATTFDGQLYDLIGNNVLHIKVRSISPSWGGITINVEGAMSYHQPTVRVYGNIMSLLYGDNFSGQTALTRNGCFKGIFKNFTHLVDASNLILPATEMMYQCYQYMFAGCTSLITAPELPATTLADNCYRQMFQGCTGLTTAQELPATTLADNCYKQMFQYCSGLTQAPALPATTLAEYCYHLMFANCTSLTQAPALPATTLAQACYAGMFWGCTSLTTPPVLPATTLAQSCYEEMFQDCTSLVSPPALPATILETSCYYGMFSGCTGLITAPVLPATTLRTQSYRQMLVGCTSLSSVTCLAEDISPANCTYLWLAGVSPTGTFYKSPNMNDWPTGNSGIPDGWTVQDYTG